MVRNQTKPVQIYNKRSTRARLQKRLSLQERLNYVFDDPISTPTSSKVVTSSFHADMLQAIPPVSDFHTTFIATSTPLPKGISDQNGSREELTSFKNLAREREKLPSRVLKTAQARLTMVSSGEEAIPPPETRIGKSICPDSQSSSNSAGPDFDHVSVTAVTNLPGSQLKILDDCVDQNRSDAPKNPSESSSLRPSSRSNTRQVPIKDPQLLNTVRQALADLYCNAVFATKARKLLSQFRGVSENDEDQLGLGLIALQFNNRREQCLGDAVSVNNVVDTQSAKAIARSEVCELATSVSMETDMAAKNLTESNQDTSIGGGGHDKDQKKARDEATSIAESVAGSLKPSNLSILDQSGTHKEDQNDIVNEASPHISDSDDNERATKNIIESNPKSLNHYGVHDEDQSDGMGEASSVAESEDDGSAAENSMDSDGNNLDQSDVHDKNQNDTEDDATHIIPESEGDRFVSENLADSDRDSSNEDGSDDEEQNDAVDHSLELPWVSGIDKLAANRDFMPNCQASSALSFDEFTPLQSQSSGSEREIVEECEDHALDNDESRNPLSSIQHTKIKLPPHKYGIFANDFDPDKYLTQWNRKSNITKPATSYAWPLRHGIFAINTSIEATQVVSKRPPSQIEIKSKAGVLQRQLEVPAHTSGGSRALKPKPRRTSMVKAPFSSSDFKKSENDNGPSIESRLLVKLDGQEPLLVSPPAAPKKRELKPIGFEGCSRDLEQNRPNTIRDVQSTSRPRPATGLKRDSRFKRKSNSIFTSQGSHSIASIKSGIELRSPSCTEQPCKMSREKPQVGPPAKIRLRRIPKTRKHNHLMESLRQLKPQKRQCA